MTKKRCKAVKQMFGCQTDAKPMCVQQMLGGWKLEAYEEAGEERERGDDD